MTVACPTLTPGTSTIALSGPVGSVPITTPASLARGRSAAWPTLATTISAPTTSIAIRIRVPRDVSPTPITQKATRLPPSLTLYLITLYHTSHSSNSSSPLSSPQHCHLPHPPPV